MEQITMSTSFLFLNQIIITLLMILPLILISRTVVAGTRYSPILIIVIFGLTMGFLLVKSKIATPGLPELPIVDIMSKVTIIALVVSFFVGGQELKKLFSKKHITIEDMVMPSEEEVILGTKRTQFVYILRAFFILLGIESIKRIVLGYTSNDPMGTYYPIIGYIGIMGSIILIDYKAKISNKRKYINKGILEIAGIFMLIVISHYISQWIKPIIALPHIFFAMILSSSLGMILSKWRFGPTIKSLLFAGIPVVLAANFMVGGSRIADAFMISDMKPVMLYGFFGQLFWMFGGLSLLILFGMANHIRILAPAMAGSLSHSGLTGACTAGDLGQAAALRAPIMINVPFLGHIFVFSILAASASSGRLIISWSLLVAILGILFTAWSLITLRRAGGNESAEIKGLMQFSFGWQLTAVFGGLLLLDFAGVSFTDAAMAKSSAISHFGLFAAIQGGMFGEKASELIAFIFAMPFLIHPLVFGMFGRAVENNGVMPEKVAYLLAIIGIIGIGYSMYFA